MNNIRSWEAEWPLDQWRRLASGLQIREVRGRKDKPWPHEQDRRIEVQTAGPVPVSMFDSLLILERYLMNEDRLFNQPHHEGRNLVYKMLADFPRIGATAAYEEHVEKPRRRRCA